MSQQGGTMPDTAFAESFDARVWATAFVQTVRENPSIATDEDTMLGWFANALMRGWDEHARRTEIGAASGSPVPPEEETR